VLENDGQRVEETEMRVEIRNDEDHAALLTSPEDNAMITTWNTGAAEIDLKSERGVADLPGEIPLKSVERAKVHYPHRKFLSRETKALYLHKPHRFKTTRTHHPL
jgi:hypothetical protein